MGLSRGGLSTKIHVAVDALGNPVRLLLTAGQTSEYTQAEALIAGCACGYVWAVVPEVKAFPAHSHARYERLARNFRPCSAWFLRSIWLCERPVFVDHYKCIHTGIYLHECVIIIWLKM